MARGYLIPDDWDGVSYHLWAFCAPASVGWDGIMRGAIYDLTRGRSWDGNTGNIVDTQEITKEIYNTMSICDDVIAGLSGIEQAIIGLGSSASACSCEGGSEFEPEPSDGTVDIGPGQRFPDQATYDLAKCSAANGIYDQVLDTIISLAIYDVDTLLSGGISIAVGLVTTLIASGPIGWGVAVILGVVSGIVTLLGGQVSFDLTDIKVILQTEHEALVCALYSASNTTSANAAFMAVVDGAGATPFESQLISFMLTDKLLNQLFNDMEQSVQDYVSPDPVDCSACPADPCVPVPILVGAVEHGSGDYSLDSASRVISSVLDPAFGLHYISFVVNAFQGSNCADLNTECGAAENFQLWVDSYSGYNFAGHSGNGLCEAGISIPPEIIGSGLPNPVGSWARTTIIEWVSSTPWTLTCRLRPTP